MSPLHIPTTKVETTTERAAAPPAPEIASQKTPTATTVQERRDPGVSDDVWYRLQADKKALEYAKERERIDTRMLSDEERALALDEAQLQAIIHQMRLCVAGYTWVKQADGYRCAGGTHFIDNASLGL